MKGSSSTGHPVNSLLTTLSKHLADLDVNWHLCGGFAIDVYVGRQTRSHKDLDITVAFDDADRCIDYLQCEGWNVEAPVGQGRLVAVDYARAHSELHFGTIWCYRGEPEFIQVTRVDGPFTYVEFNRTQQDSLDFLEVLFNRIDEEKLYYKRDHSITRGLDRAFFKRGAMSVLSPEVVLLYKASAVDNQQYVHDFEVAVQCMGVERLTWFADAVKRAYGEHPWGRQAQARLAAAAGEPRSPEHE